MNKILLNNKTYDMKSTVIYEKKQITIGELVNSYNYNLIWFGIILVQLLLTFYIDNSLKNITKTKLCQNLELIKYQCEDDLKILSEKIIMSRYILCIFLLLNLSSMIIKKYIDECKKYYTKYNKLRDFTFEFIPIHIYYLSSLFNKPLLLHYIFIRKKIPNNKNNIIVPELINILTYYSLSEIYGCTLLLSFSILIIVNIYESMVKNIKIEYIDTKFIDVEKNT